MTPSEMVEIPRFGATRRFVTPAKAGVQGREELDSRFHGNDAQGKKSFA